MVLLIQINLNCLISFLSSFKFQYGSTNTDNKKSSKNKTNGGYSQKIILKSKKKKYIIKDTDNFVLKKKKEFSYHVSSWLTRGHYRRCGKNKVIKYIPPTIHKRKNLNSDKTNKKTYEIK